MIYYKNKAIKLIHKNKLIKKYLIDPSVILNIHEFETKPDEIFVLKDTNNPLYRELIWTSSDDTVATVNNFGEVKILSEGIVTIRCTNAYGKYDECVFTVFNKDYTRTINYYSKEELGCCKYSISADDYNESDGTWKARKYETYTKDDGTIIGSEDVAISGTVIKESNAIVFDGTQKINLSSMGSLYGWGSSNAAQSDYMYSVELEFTEFVNKNIHAGMSINTNGYINTNLYQLELNKRYKLICMRRHSDFNTYTGFTGRIIVCSNNIIEYDSGWDKISSGGHWVEALSLLNSTGFIGKFYNMKLFICSHNKRNMTAEQADAKDIKAIDNPIINDYIVNNEYKITAPILDFTNRYVVHDLASNNKPTLIVRVLNNDILIGEDKSVNKYDLIQYHPDGSIQKIYRNVLSTTAGRKVELDIDMYAPFRDYLFFGLYDNETKTIQKSRLFSVRFTDSRIDKSNYNADGDDVIAKQMYVSPMNLIGRPGDKKLLRVTFVPEQVANIKVKYISTDTSVATVGENDGIVEFIKPGICEIIAISQSNTKVLAKSVVRVEKPISDTEKITIDNDMYGITMGDGTESNNWEAAWNNTLGINAALKDLKAKGYKYIKLPEGHYYMACENMSTRENKSINLISDIEFDITGCTIEQVMSESPDVRVIMLDNCDRSKLIGGTVIGDLFIHNYGLRINENGDMLEEGSYSSTTGLPIKPDTSAGETYNSLDSNHNAGSYFRTKDFITEYTDYETTEPEPIPTNFNITPLWKTNMNTVDGGQYYCYFYNDNDELVGFRRGGFGTSTMPEGATKIKLSFRSEIWDKAIYCMTKRDSNTHATFEFGTGVGFKNSFDCEINGTTIMNCQGDVSMTSPGSDKYFTNEYGEYVGYDVLVSDARWINCTMKEARRQGISFVATGENYLILDSSIGNINGVDPQCGIDMEAYGRNEKFLFKNVTFHDNRKWDMVDCFSGDVEIDSCTFNGAIGLGQESYNWYVHDCNFIYDDKYNRNAETSDEWTRLYKIHNVAGCNLPISVTDKYIYAIIENNYFNGGKSKSLAFGTSSKNAYSLNNNIENGNVITFNADSCNDTIQCNGIRIINNAVVNNIKLNNHENSNISITFEGQYPKQPKLITDDRENYIINPSNNKTFGAGGAYRAIGIVDNLIIHNYSVEGKTSGLVIVKNCDIINNDDISVIGSTFSNTTCFKNCRINIPRKQCGVTYVGGGQGSYENYEYVGITFEDCEIEIRDVESTNNTTSIDMFNYGYGDFKCPIMLRRCHIKGSDKKTVLNTVQIEDCTFEGGATPYSYTQLTDITLPESLDVVIDTQTQIPVTLTPGITRRIFWELPEGLHMTITADNKITCTKLGTYTIVAKSYDGSKIRKSMTINVIEAPTQETV